MNLISLSDINHASKRINEYIHLTPVMTSTTINTILGRNVFFKCENLQKTGSFKIRGALNNILSKMETKSILGVVTHSSGNHGQAVAYAAKLLNIPAIIVIPKSTPTVKCDAIRNYGAKLHFVDNSALLRVETCSRLANEFSYEIIHPFDDYDTMAGQGTLGVEFFNQVPQLDAVIISISGGGLSAGCAVALKSLNPNIKIYCVEPEGKELESSLRAEQRLWKGEQKLLDTIAEGIMLQQPGTLTFPILCNFIEKNVLTVNNSEMIEGMKISMKYLKQVIEASAGASVQAMFKYNDLIPKTCENIGIILCGGNYDIEKMF